MVARIPLRRSALAVLVLAAFIAVAWLGSSQNAQAGGAVLAERSAAATHSSCTGKPLQFTSIASLTGPLPARLPSIGGNPPNPAALPPGCAFAPRCPYVFERCRGERPPLVEVDPGHSRSCFHDGPLGGYGA